MIRQTVTVLISVLTFSAFAADLSESERAAIVERIKPVGSVYIASNEPVSNEPAAPRDGAAVYNVYCTACHSTGVSGAPKKGNAADWEARIAQGEETLLNHAINGLNVMPPKGTCMDCSDDEIKAAIEHMIAGL